MPFRIQWGEQILPLLLMVVLGILLELIPAVPIGFVVVSLCVILALRCPLITIALTILLGQVAQFELAPLLGVSPQGVSLGAMDIRFSDPLILGMVVAFLIRLTTRDDQAVRFMKREGALLVLFLLYLFLRIAVNIGTFGISAPGEFRTYFQFLLFVPYIVVSAGTPARRKSLFLLLIVLSFSQLLWGLLRGFVLYGMTFSAYEKWLSGFGSLALLYGMLAYASGCREHVLTQGSVRRILVYIASMAMIVIAGARAVWFAGACVLLFLGLQRQVSTRHLVRGGLLVILVVLVVSPFFLKAGLHPGEFLLERMLAFTDFSSDPTAAWRYTFWLASLEEIIKNPWFGHGFGLHFDVYVPQFREILTTSPHNLYLSILYQAGIVGLLLYLSWVLFLAVRLKKAQVSGGADKAIVGTALLVLVSVHAYGIAYSFEKDFFTWAYIGLAVSALIHSVGNKQHPPTGDS